MGLEMSGSAAGLNQLLKAMRNGGKVSLLGLQGPDTKIDWDDSHPEGPVRPGHLRPQDLCHLEQDDRTWCRAAWT